MKPSKVERGKGVVIAASMGCFSTGINIRNIHNIVFASPSKSQIRILQSIGRGLRVSDDGRPTQVYDIADDLHIGDSYRNYTLNHASERIKIYARERFEYTINQIKLKDE
jgi:type I site-specific restriction endonuclease